MNRRKFLSNLSYGVGSVLSLKNARAATARGEKTLSKIGLQLYTVRKDLEENFEVTLRRVAALGIKEVEFAGYFNRSPQEIKKILKNLKLAAPSAHIDTKTLRDELPRAIEEAKIIGHEYLILGYLPEEERKSPGDYKKLIALLNRAGEECRRANLQLAYHNHDFEFAKTENKTPYDLILAETDARLVKMEMDLYWTSKAGLDPLDYFEKYPGRFPLVHVKDMDNTARKYFTEVGRGVINFGKIFAQAEKAGIRHYFIEQDQTPAAPLESVRISFDYLRSLKY